MAARRKIIALFLLVLWLPFTGHCMGAHWHHDCISEVGACEHPGHHGEDESPADCDAHHHDLSAARPAAAIVPLMDYVVSDLCEVLGMALNRRAHLSLSAFPHAPPDPPPLHIEVMRAAHPVRGPSH